MSRSSVYQELESKMLRYADLVGVPVSECGEPMRRVKKEKTLLARQIDERMLKVTGKEIYVRESVAGMLKQAAAKLQMLDKNFSLEVVYGYRSLAIQTALFNKFKSRFSRQCSGMNLLEAVHRCIAVPSVSGHPTGGAVDVQILKKGKVLNFGTKIWEFTPDSYTFSPFVSKAAQANRLLLREIMLNTGFAPFDGEWWHYSYGDREWAKYYSKNTAIYSQVRFWSK